MLSEPYFLQLTRVQSSGNAQRNWTWAAIAIPNPPLAIGDRVVRPWSAGERITHSSIGDRCTNDNSKRHTSVAYLPFRWHQRDPAKVRNFVSRLLHSAAVSWTELRSLPAREANGRCAVGQFRGGGRRETTRMIHLDRRAFSAPKLRINGMSVYPWTSILSVYLGDLSIHKKRFFGTIWSPSRSRILSAADMRDFSWIRSFALTEADLAKRT